MKRFIGSLLTLNHDLNNSLAGVMGYLELVTLDHGSTLPPKTLDLIQAAQKSAQGLEELIRSFSKVKFAFTEKVNTLPLSSIPPPDRP